MHIEALRTPLSEDLRPLSAFLTSQRIPHKISEHQGEQVVWVIDQRAVSLVHALYQRLQAGDLPEVQLVRRRVSRPARQAAFLPVTVLLIVASVVGATLVAVYPDIASVLSYYRITEVGQGYVVSTVPGQFWRLFTPVFLHFGLLHIAFNSLWVWELGRRIEFAQGSWWFLLMTVAVGIASNLAQVWYTPGQLFGGMSGVIYGYLGYIAVWQRVSPLPAFALPPGIIVFMLVWLVICMFGFTELFGLGSIANAAHLGGLVAGVLVAAAGLTFQRIRA